MTYPFDPLNEAEQKSCIATVGTLLGIYDPMNDPAITLGPFDEFDRISLIEPKKKEMLAFIHSAGPRPLRKALVTFYKGVNDIYEKYVLTLNTDGSGEVLDVVGPKQICNARPGWSCDPSSCIAEALVRSDPRFIAALKSKGLTDDEIANNLYLDVSVDSRLDDLAKCINCQGPYRVLKEYTPGNRPRVYALTPYYNEDPYQGITYIEPIQGIIAWVDRRTNTVISVYNENKVYPIIKDQQDWNRGSRGTLKPLAMSMPEGPSYSLDGQRVCWEKWKFRWGVDNTYGLILYEITYGGISCDTDYNVDRSVLYRANMPELITAYCSNNIPSKGRNFLDIGEYYARDYLVPQVSGIDTPPYAEFFSVPFTFPNGNTFYTDNAVSLYEQDAGMLWRHTDYPCLCPGNDTETRTRGRRGRELVISTIHTVGNYDYAFFWIFAQDGSIRFEMKLTGQLECEGTTCAKVVDSEKLTPSEKANGCCTEKDLTNAPLVHKYILGPSHYHTACLRLDFDIDGQSNRVIENELKLLPVNAKDNACGNVFVETERVLKNEKCAIRDHNFKKSRSWSIINNNSTTDIGNPHGYKLIPFPMTPLVNPKSRIGKRSEYIQHNLFVTRYSDHQLTPMGMFPVEKSRDEGLKIYSKKNRNLVDKDIVVWYCTGFSHPPSQDQYPVLNSEVVRVLITPENFFDENPALDIDEDKLVSCSPI